MNIWSYKFSNYHLGINIKRVERGSERVSRGSIVGGERYQGEKYRGRGAREMHRVSTSLIIEKILL